MEMYLNTNTLESISNTCSNTFNFHYIANYITVTTDSQTSIYRGKGHNMLFIKPGGP